MEFIKNMPGLSSQNGQRKLMAIIYYSICMGLVINYKMSIQVFFLILSPFVFKLLKVNGRPNEDEEIEKTVKSLLVVMASVFVLNLSISFVSDKFLGIEELQEQSEKLKDQYYLLKEENEKLLEQELNSEKARLKEENQVLREEKEYLENKLD